MSKADRTSGCELHFGVLNDKALELFQGFQFHLLRHLGFGNPQLQFLYFALRLVTVVPTTSTLSAERAGAGALLPNAMAEILELAQRGAVEYLQEVVRRLSAENVPATAEVARGEIAAAILDAEKRASADLVVLATHGRSAVDAFWAGSVTPKVLAQSRDLLLRGGRIGGRLDLFNLLFEFPHVFLLPVRLIHKVPWIVRMPNSCRMGVSEYNRFLPAK
jgi:nucleotide-binding universal stress UspA family protein